tara:strand:- start:1531 stop:2655 length:1125 start_codon:yes stop_codon:yes gene_type:complete
MIKAVNNSFWKNKRVLITGHNGFKGAWLTIWLLTLGSKVWGFSLSPQSSPNLFEEIYKDSKNNDLWSNFEEVNNDITKIKKISSYVNLVKPDIIFHMTAQSLVMESYLNPVKTWETNVIGSLNLLESLKSYKKECSIIMVTTDKVYENKEWFYGYRETDLIGGKDPYSSSKAAMELAVSSWRNSFVGYKVNQNKNLKIATARAGNVIGGGDWAKDRIIPDIVRSISNNKELIIRNPLSTRPWQHVLDPLHGYILLAEKLYNSRLDSEENYNMFSAFNFGPSFQSNKNVENLVNEFLKYWKGSYKISNDDPYFHEANYLYLMSDKARNILKWENVLDFENSIKMTAIWYKEFYESGKSFSNCIRNIDEFNRKLGI